MKRASVPQLRIKVGHHQLYSEMLDWHHLLCQRLKTVTSQNHLSPPVGRGLGAHKQMYSHSSHVFFKLRYWWGTDTPPPGLVLLYHFKQPFSLRSHRSSLSASREKTAYLRMISLPLSYLQPAVTELVTILLDNSIICVPKSTEK